MPRIEFELTDEELDGLKNASRSTPVMYGNGGTPLFSSPQENANRAWRALGEQHGFQFMTVQPVAGKDAHFFTAEQS